ncbi:hypothetical protein EI94DRAFT_1701058 [Lactarius quietus]|nr:hypothetical protein EI94DRAFT_1701058 [Lactarius quietus]
MSQKHRHGDAIDRSKHEKIPVLPDNRNSHFATFSFTAYLSIAAPTPSTLPLPHNLCGSPNFYPFHLQKSTTLSPCVTASVFTRSSRHCLPSTTQPFPLQTIVDLLKILSEPNKGLYSSPSTTSTVINITTKAATGACKSLLKALNSLGEILSCVLGFKTPESFKTLIFKGLMKTRSMRCSVSHYDERHLYLSTTPGTPSTAAPIAELNINT